MKREVHTSTSFVYWKITVVWEKKKKAPCNFLSCEPFFIKHWKEMDKLSLGLKSPEDIFSKMAVSSVLQGKQTTVFTTNDKTLTFNLKLKFWKICICPWESWQLPKILLVRQVVRVTNDFLIL